MHTGHIIILDQSGATKGLFYHTLGTYQTGQSILLGRRKLIETGGVCLKALLCDTINTSLEAGVP